MSTRFFRFYSPLSAACSHQGRLLEALEADVVLVQHLVRIEVRLVVVGGDDHVFAHLAIVGAVREDDLVHLRKPSRPQPPPPPPPKTRRKATSTQAQQSKAQKHVPGT